MAKTGIPKKKKQRSMKANHSSLVRECCKTMLMFKHDLVTIKKNKKVDTNM